MTKLPDFEQFEQEVLAHAHLSYGERLRPERDWFILLMIVGMLFLGSIAVNILIYEGVKRNAEGVATPTSTVAADTDAIRAVQNVFDARAAEEVNYKNVYHFVDPAK